MKTLALRAVLLYMVSLLSGLYFVSCSKKSDPVPAPVITFDIGETNIPGTIYTYNRTLYATSYVWDFGDGTQSNKFDPDHAYARNGTYQVTLRATGRGGESSSSQTITISSLSSGNPTNPTNPTSPKPGRAVFFTSQTSGWSSITVSIDGVNEGSFSSSFSSTPSCGALGALTISRSPGIYNYTARSNTGLVWNGTIPITENGCQPFRLDFPTGGTTLQTGQYAFWTGQTTGWSTIDVSVDGSYAGTINGVYHTTTPACGTNGTVTVTKAPGTYSFSAKSNTGTTWNGTVTISANGCSTLKLEFPNNTSQTGQFAFFTSKSSGWSTISISVDGVNVGSINGKYFTGIPDCGTNGTVTITKVPGTYNYSALSNTGAKWSGTLKVLGNQCSTLRLDF